MTTDLARVEPETGLVISPSITGDVDLDGWLDDAAKAHRFAVGLARSAFVPRSFKPTDLRPGTDEWLEVVAANMTGAILLGKSLGVTSPLVALQNIFVVEGRPSMYAKFKKGLLEARGYQVWTEEFTPESVTVAGWRPGWPQDRVERRTVTWDDAVRAKWAEKETYKRTPADMLYARALGRVCDAIGSDVLLGIPTVDDSADAADLPDRAAPALPAPVAARPVGAGADTLRSALADQLAVREAQASTALDKDPEGGTRPVDDATTYEDAVDDDGDDVQVEDPPADGPVVLGYGAADEDPAAEHTPATRVQLAELAQLFGGRWGIAGEGSRAERSRIVSNVLGRRVGSATELTQAEAAWVLDRVRDLDRAGLYALVDAATASEGGDRG